jgi:hypothetical protein
MEAHFRYYIDHDKLPKTTVCKAFLEKFECRRGRTPRDVYDKVKALIKKK